MKKFSKLFSGVLAALMVGTMSLTSFAATTDSTTLKAAATTKEDYYPGVEYRWNLTFDGKEINRQLMSQFSDKVYTSTGKKYIDSADVRKSSDGTYDLYIKPINKRYSSPKDLAVSVQFTNRDTKKTYTTTVRFEVAFDEEEIIYDEVVFMSENSSRMLEFDSDLEVCEIYFDDLASFDADLRRTHKADFRYTTEEIPQIVEENPQAYCSFLKFTGNPSFRDNGTLYFYTKKDYLYSYNASSGLKLLSDKNNSDIIAIRTGTLGTYVLSDEPLKLSSNNVDVSGMDKPTDITGDGNVTVTPGGGRINVSKDVITNKQFSGSSYILNCQMGDYITPSDVDTMNSYLGNKGIAFRVTDNKGTVISQMLIRPYKNRNVTQDIKIGANMDCAKTLSLFRSWYDNKLVGFHMQHYGAIGTPVEMAVKLDYSGINTNNLVAYVYYPKSNTFERLSNTNLYIDSAGFTHLVTVAGGDIVISEGPLTDK